MKIVSLFMLGLAVGIMAMGVLGFVAPSSVQPPVVAGVDAATYIKMLKGRAYSQRKRIEQLKQENDVLTQQLAQFGSGVAISVATPP